MEHRRDVSCPVALRAVEHAVRGCVRVPLAEILWI